MALTVDDMMSWRQVGVGTIDAILQTLADASTTAATPTVTSFSDAFETTARRGHSMSCGSPDWMLALIDDLTTVATWFATVGFPGQALLGARSRRHAGRDRQGSSSDRVADRRPDSG